MIQLEPWHWGVGALLLTFAWSLTDDLAAARGRDRYLVSVSYLVAALAYVMAFFSWLIWWSAVS